MTGYCTSSFKRCSPKVYSSGSPTVDTPSVTTIQVRATAVFHIHSILSYSAADLDILAQQIDFSQTLNGLNIIGLKHSVQWKKKKW